MTRKLHPLEMRPISSTRVHAGAFARMVDTIANFDGLTAQEATTEALRMLEAGEVALKVEQAHAVYQHKA